MRPTPTSRCSAWTSTPRPGRAARGAPRAGWPGSGWRPWASAARCRRPAGSPASPGTSRWSPTTSGTRCSAGQPPETRLFMLRTSVTEQMSGDLADALTGEPGGARTLERLSRENSFVEALGHGHGGLPLPPAAARRAGRRAAAGRCRTRCPILLRRAARWHAAHDQAIDALRSAAQAGDWDYAAHMLAEAGTAALVRSGAGHAGAGAGRCSRPSAGPTTPPWPRRWPRPGCGQGDPDGAAPHLDGAAARRWAGCDSGRAPGHRALAGGPAGDAGRQPGRGRPRPAGPGLGLAEQAQATAGTRPEHRAARAALVRARARARLRRWEIHAARYALDHASRQLTAGGLRELCARARGWQALAEAWYGDLAAAAPAAARAEAGRPGPAARSRDPGGLVPGRARVGAGQPGPRRPGRGAQAAGRRGRVRGRPAPAAWRALARRGRRR